MCLDPPLPGLLIELCCEGYVSENETDVPRSDASIVILSITHGGHVELERGPERIGLSRQYRH